MLPRPLINMLRPAVFCLPFLVLPTLKLRKLVRIGVYCTFGLGILNVGFCLARFLAIRLSPHTVAQGMISFTQVGKGSLQPQSSVSPTLTVHNRRALERRRWLHGGAGR